jgi:hypothetical protein
MCDAPPFGLAKPSILRYNVPVSPPITKEETPGRSFVTPWSGVFCYLPPVSVWQSQRVGQDKQSIHTQ